MQAVASAKRRKRSMNSLLSKARPAREARSCCPRATRWAIVSRSAGRPTRPIGEVPHSRLAPRRSTTQPTQLGQRFTSLLREGGSESPEARARGTGCSASINARSRPECCLSSPSRNTRNPQPSLLQERPASVLIDTGSSIQVVAPWWLAPAAHMHRRRRSMPHRLYLRAAAHCC